MKICRRKTVKGNHHHQQRRNEVMLLTVSLYKSMKNLLLGSWLQADSHVCFRKSTFCLYDGNLYNFAEISNAPGWGEDGGNTLFEKSRGRSPWCGGLSLSLISSVFRIQVWVRGWVGEIKIWTDSGYQCRLYMLTSDLTPQKNCKPL